MFKLLNVRTALWISAVLMAAGCSSPKQAVYDHEHFDDAGTFSRSYPATDMAYCEAGRRAGCLRVGHGHVEGVLNAPAVIHQTIREAVREEFHGVSPACHFV